MAALCAIRPTLKGMTPPRTSRAIGGGRVDLDRVEKVIDARYLSLVEREQLRICAEPEDRCARSPPNSAVRHRRSVGNYGATRCRTVKLLHTAHRLSVQRRRRPRTPKILANAELRSYIEARLKKRWSPRQISRRMKKDFPDAPEMRVSTETIYQAIYVHARGELERELAKQLRRGRTARKPQKRPDVRRPRFVDPMTSICQRPPDVRRPRCSWTLGRRSHRRSGRRVGHRHACRTNQPIRPTRSPSTEQNADAVRDGLIDAIAPSRHLASEPDLGPRGRDG